MARSYADITTLILQMLQDTGAATYDSTETGYWIEEELKSVLYPPHIIDVIFKIESRSGTDGTAVGVTSTLTDASKSQFLTTDPTNEKVIHNIKDNTWAVVLTRTSESVLTLSADIMRSGEQYEIYNKRCRNKKQIYIGDVADYLHIDSIYSVEYPIGQNRNWTLYDNVLEILVDRVQDSDPTKSPLLNVDVLVRFVKPHRLCELTDLAGACTAVEPEGETTLAVKSLLGGETIEIGDELHIENHRTLYTVTTGKLLAGSGAGNGTGDIIVFPGMEAATAINDVITFVKSTLKPHHEEIFCHRVAARAVLSDNIRHINAIPKGGQAVWSNMQVWAERKLAETEAKLNSISKVEPKRTWPRD